MIDRIILKAIFEMLKANPLYRGRYDYTSNDLENQHNIVNDDELEIFCNTLPFSECLMMTEKSLFSRPITLHLHLSEVTFPSRLSERERAWPEPWWEMRSRKCGSSVGVCAAVSLGRAVNIPSSSSSESLRTLGSMCVIAQLRCVITTGNRADSSSSVTCT